MIKMLFAIFFCAMKAWRLCVIEMSVYLITIATFTGKTDARIISTTVATVTNQAGSAITSATVAKVTEKANPEIASTTIVTQQKTTKQSKGVTEECSSWCTTFKEPWKKKCDTGFCDGCSQCRGGSIMHVSILVEKEFV